MPEEIPESMEVRQYARQRQRDADLRLLEARVRRRLQEGRLVLHKTRGERQRHLLGRYWVTDRLGVMPILRDVDLPSLARRLHVYLADLSHD